MRAVGFSRLGGTVVAGHGVASGRGGDGRFPGGTLGMQIPVFLEAGIDLRGYYKGTLNVSVAPYGIRVVGAKRTLRGVVWKDGYAAEDFSFVECGLWVGGVRHEGLVYWPHPETKPEHFQDPSVVEVLAGWIVGVEVGVG
ncbi:MAG: hypothetical protein P8J87_07055, partial [Verrucomicrobiales bacterium]|nr:hypothetical protein [Verrucomicrobiales bacterium]